MLTLISGLFFTAVAQDNSLKHGKEDRKKMMKDMNLSKQQKMQMKAFMKSNKADKELLNNDKSLTPQQRKERMMQLRKEQQEKIATILTPEQREKMKEKMMENRNKYPQSPKQRDPVVKNPDNK
jgi:Spy/CpxP family protein refolding chaperone